MLQLESVSKHYHHQDQPIPAVDDVSLSVQEGKIFGVIGHSGAGKSTLVRCMNLLERPDSGRILVDGTDLTTLSPAALGQARKRIGMIFQHFNLQHSRTVYENVQLPLEFSGTPRGEMRSRVNDLLERVGLSSLKDRYPAALSGGQKQRVAIARALAHDPALLLCDEATSALDPQSTDSILSLLKSLNKDMNLTIVLITHEMQVIKRICDQVAIIDAGKIIESQSVLDLFAAPKTEVAKTFVASTTHMKIPAPIANQMVLEATPNTAPIYRLTYIGSITSEPLLSMLSSRFQVAVNILQANIETLQGQTLGQIMVTLSGEPERIGEGLKFLEKNNLHIEVLGHVRRDA